VVETAAKKLRSRPGDPLVVETSVLEGHPKHVIAEEAEKWGADLIIMGSHGYRGLKRLWLGSVSHAVAAHAHCSVEIVRAHEE
ncbi:MAG: universal stress protein, partial [Acidobacteria bacterium]|nr:universal stress protein [Acidobacteriota bacterium]